MKKRSQKLVSLVAAAVLAWGAIVPVAPNVAHAESSASKLVLGWQTPIGEGTSLYKYSKQFGDKTALLYVTKVDLNNPYVEVKPVYGSNQQLTSRQSVSQMANETGAIAAVNADFFNTTKRGAPFGIVMKDKEIVSSMGQIPYWYSFGVTSDHTAAITNFGFQGKVTAADGTVFSLRGVNKEEYNPGDGLKSHVNQLNLYTPKFGKTSLGIIPNYVHVVEEVFVDGVATEIRVDKPGAPIPPNGFVLWGNGQAAQFLEQHVPIGSRVQLDYQTTPTSQDWAQAVGGHILLADGGVPLTYFPTENYIKGINAHTAVGVSQDGKTMWIVTAEKSANSRGVSLAELGQIMVELGAYRAMNFDGGGSTTLAARNLGETSAKVAMTPSEGSERRVPTGLAVYNTAPQGSLASFQITGPTELLIGQEAEYSVGKAYDSHYQPYKINPSDVVWTAAQTDAGTVDRNRFTATKSGTVGLVAQVGGVTKQQDIHVYSGADVQQIAVSPNPIYIGLGQTMDLDVKVKTKSGKTITANPRSVKGSIDSDVASLNDQLQIVASNKEGNAKLTLSYDGVSTSVPIVVGEVEQPWLTFDNQVGMYHTAIPDTLSSQGSFAAVSGDNVPVYRSKKSAKLTYNFAGADKNDVRIAYGRLGANPVAIPGKPFGLGVWVYGDNSNHWLRAEVLDAKGKTYYVDLAKQIDWTGWKQVKGSFPGEAVYPLSLRSIYVVNTPENTDQRPEKGTLYFDELSLLYPHNAVNTVTGTDVIPTQPGKLSLGSELDMNYNFQQAASFLDKARIDVQSIVDQQVPGYVPADYSFSIKPTAVKAGKQDQISTSPVTLTFTPKQWVQGKGIGLLYVNQANQTYDVLNGQMDANRNWVYQVNSYGTYIPYYLDAPADTPFFDILNHPARTEITAMAAKGYVKGTSPDMFSPEDPLTRAQFVTMLARVYNWELPAKPKLMFKDQIPAYAQGPVQVALSKGIVKGYDDKTFKPDQTISRAEAAVILDRVLKKQATPNKLLADKKSWPSWAVGPINHIVGLGLIDPISNKFEPNKPTTRAVFVVALYRMTIGK
ncbi:phosphodiester glycosidase family protein [Brevibacillus ginsengisoli]|uniref:phosphodiester glycosidase family protein n=1 Tax=Brevibacillus ginsengisoli TaxID=363854 RepID=UPI003CEDBC8B